jgi:hypothetical protein
VNKTLPRKSLEERYPLVNKDIFKVIQVVLDPKVIDGALRSAIHAHNMISLGPRTIRLIEKDAKGNDLVSEIVTCSTGSASKRIRGAIRTRVIEYLEAEQKRQQALTPTKQVWYNRLVRLVRR